MSQVARMFARVLHTAQQSRIASSHNNKGHDVLISLLLKVPFSDR